MVKGWPIQVSFHHVRPRIAAAGVQFPRRRVQILKAARLSEVGVTSFFKDMAGVTATGNRTARGSFMPWKVCPISARDYFCSVWYEDAEVK